MQKKIIAACVSLVAFAAVAVMPAVASATVGLTEPANTRLAVGALVEATNTESIVFVSNLGDVTCTKSTLTGDVKENTTTSVRVTITKATFTNNEGGQCTSSFGNWTVTTEIAKVDWCITSTETGKWHLQANACGNTGTALNFTLENAFTGECKYTRSHATGPVRGTYTSGGNTLSITNTVAGSGFVKSSGGFACPSEGTLRGAYTLETDETFTHIIVD